MSKHKVRIPPPFSAPGIRTTLQYTLIRILSLRKAPAIVVFLSCLLSASITIAQELSNQSGTERQRYNYRRTDPKNFPPVEVYTRPKEEVFPAGYKTKSLNKVISATGIWTELNPKVPRVTYIGLYFINKDTGWACGESGAVIKTTNGGIDWSISETPINNLLLKTHSYNGQIVLVAGFDGLILRSGDEGNTFQQVTSGVGTGYDLWGVQMLNDTLGWVCGLNNTLLKTTNGGLSWLHINTGFNYNYWALSFINEQYGMIPCDSGKVLKTTDGGNSWQRIQAGDTKPLFTIDIIDSLHIAAAGAYGKNVYSSDAGATWISNPNIPAATATNWIDFINPDTGYSVQDVYNIRKTTNRGQSWYNPNSVYELSEWHIQLLNDGTGYSCGEEAGYNYALSFYKRTDNLDNWSRLFLNDNFADVFFTSSDLGFAISGVLTNLPKLYKSTNGGMSWTVIPDVPGGSDVLFLDSLTGFVGSNQIYKTTDGGASWYTPNGGEGGAGKLFFVNSTTGWAIRNNFILKTTDRGENWTTQFTGVSGYTSIYFRDSLNGWATNTYVWQTTDGGNTWIQQSNFPYDTYDDIYFMNQDTGWVSIYSIIFTSLYKTSNKGLNWAPVNEVIGSRHFFFFPDPSHWMDIGWSRYYITYDYGNSWVEITNDLPEGLSSFYAPANLLGYSVGTKGLILRFEDTTYIPVELISFEGEIRNNEVVLFWITATELNNKGFYIEKSQDKLQWRSIGFVEGAGNSTQSNEYNFVDMEAISGEVYYRLKMLDYSASFIYSKIVEIVPPINEFTLFQNYPNPANPVTTIKYDLPVSGNVSLIIYDVLGRKVKELVNSKQQAGKFAVQFNAENLASGVYIYQFRTDSFMSSKKLMVLK